MKRWNLICAVALTLAAASSVDAATTATAPEPVSDIQAVALSYGIDASLTYVDAVQNSRLNGQFGGLNLMDPKLAADPRVLGLGRLRAVLDWQAPSSARLRVVLRPDAVSRRDEGGADFIPREFDTRSGDIGMQPLPSIRLLDAYQVTMPLASRLNLEAGVLESFRQASVVYAPVLGFGLDVILPAKFAGLVMDWQAVPKDLPTATNPSPLLSTPEYGLQLFYFLGDQDRGELISGHHGSYDLGPSARDPYQGTALSVSWHPSATFEASGLAGYLRTSELGGGYDRSFGELTALGHFSALGQHHKLGFGGRLQKDHGRDGVAPQNLISGQINLAWGLNPTSAALLGIRGGRGTRWTSYSTQRTTTVDLRGYQIEAGGQLNLHGGLAITGLISREYRTLDSGGQRLGGFSDQDGARHLIHRVGIEIAYRLSSHH